MRYRIRFVLQEIDLEGDDVLIGRGSQCTVTIDDPLVSRQHLRLAFAGSEPRIHDLSSRNGTLLNGKPLVGSAVLRDGDRIRIGTQELVFLASGDDRTTHRTTGSLTVCIDCGIPYPRARDRCPHCGSPPTADGEDTVVMDGPASGWTFHLLSEVVDRAIDQGRLADADRMMKRGVDELQEQLDRGREIDPDRVFRVAESALRLGCALRSAGWIERSGHLYRRFARPPSGDSLALLDALPAEPQLEGPIRFVAGLAYRLT